MHKKYKRWIRICIIRWLNEFQIQDGAIMFRSTGVRKLFRRRKSGKFQSSVRPSTGAESARSVTPDINTGAALVAKLSGHSPESSLTKSLQLSERGASLPFPLSKGNEKKRGEHRKFLLSSLVSGNWTCTRA